MAEYNAFLDIVKERHDPTIKRSKLECPYCGSKRVKNDGEGTTLVGGYNNHITIAAHCKSCRKHFHLELKEQGSKRKYIGWYTAKNKILRGIAGCFENYIYTCSKCNGDVRRHQLEMDSDEHVKYLQSGPDENGVWHNSYRTIFRCDSCGVEVESENDYYNPNPPPFMTYEEKVEEARKRKEKSDKLMAGWTITEEIGITVINMDCVPEVLTNAMSKEIEKEIENGEE